MVPEQVAPNCINPQTNSITRSTAHLEAKSLLVVKEERRVKPILLQVFKIEISGLDFLDEIGVVSVGSEFLLQTESGSIASVGAIQCRRQALVIQVPLALLVPQRPGDPASAALGLVGSRHCFLFMVG